MKNNTTAKTTYIPIGSNLSYIIRDNGLRELNIFNSYSLCKPRCKPSKLNIENTLELATLLIYKVP